MFRRCPLVLLSAARGGKWGQWQHKHGHSTGATQDHRQAEQEARQETRGEDPDRDAQEDADEESGTMTEDEPEYMKLMEAYHIFGYKLGDKIEAPEIKKRFKKLALKAHPDQGGSEEQFRQLIEAQKLMLSARHDKAFRDKSGKKKSEKYHPPKYNYNYYSDSVEKAGPIENAAEYALDSKMDLFLVLATLGGIYYFWGERMKDRVMVLNNTRGRLDPEDMAPKPEIIYKPKGEWHAWRANNQDLSRLKQIEEWAHPKLRVDERDQALLDGTIKQGPMPGTAEAIKANLGNVLVSTERVSDPVAIPIREVEMPMPSTG